MDPFRLVASPGVSLAQREAKAEELLRQLFGQAALDEYRAHGIISFKVRLWGKDVLVMVHGVQVVVKPMPVLQASPLGGERHCIQPLRFRHYPDADNIVTMALRIKADPEKFFQTANPGYYCQPAWWMP